MPSNALSSINHFQDLFCLPDNTPPIEKILSEAVSDPYSYRKLEEMFRNEDYTNAFQVLAPHFTYALGLHWLYKSKWSSTHKIPNWKEFPNETRQGVKFFGEFLKNLVELCIQMHPVITSGYENAGVLFKYLVWELKAEESECPEESQVAVIKKHQARIKQLRSLENPYPVSQFPHMHSFMALCIAVFEQHNQIKINYFLPFLKSYTAWVEDLRKNPKWVTHFVKDEKVGSYPSKGKNIKYLYSPLTGTLT